MTTLFAELLLMFLAISASLREKIVREVILTVQKTKTAKIQAEILSKLAIFESMPLKEELLQQALNATRRISWKWNRFKILAKIAFQLAESEEFEKAITVVHVIEDKVLQVEVLTNMVPYFSEPLKRDRYRG